ncbi:MAG: DUF4260 domain-containing protein [Flavobacteriales bacterium]|nr:DUF4260 domain-containing protein [Flavobacteriales bacterium]MBP9080009.1 DUF4260 domain-containing protein [Flavobacteriales bacterium]
MKTLLKTEELAQLLACMATLAAQGVPWWAWLLLLLGPDIGMLGYLIGPRTGAFTYNLLHHKGTALLVAAIGLGSAWYTVPLGVSPQALLIAGVVLYGHSSMDRMLGFGLKHGDGFQHTHLGWIGQAAPGTRHKIDDQGR